MYRLILFLGICSAIASGIKGKRPSEDSEKMVGCYHVFSDPYNLKDPQPELVKKGIDASICSHLFYSFVGIGTNGSILSDIPYSDLDDDDFPHFNGRWKKNPPIKILARMAALDDQSSGNNSVLTDPHLRGKVVKNVVDFLEKFVFNGIDLDLSNMQTIDGNSETDKKNLVLLLKALKAAFDKQGFILSVSVDPSEDNAENLYDIKGISTNVNFISLMACNFNAPDFLLDDKVKVVGHPSPLYSSKTEDGEERKENVDYVVTYWLRLGVPANKLILGTCLTGQSYTLANPKGKIGRGAPVTREGYYSADIEYSKLCSRSKKPEWNYVYDNEQQVPYFYKGNKIVAAEDVASLKAKAKYVNAKKLGGIMAVSVDQDDIGGKCGEKFPLMKALNQVLRNKP